MFLILLIVSICHISASPRLSAEEECHHELSELRRSISSLENKLLIGEWQLKNLRDHNHFFRPKKVDMSASLNTTEMNEPMPASQPKMSGNLIIYDKDCSELYSRARSPSGYYRIKPKPDVEPFVVYCDMSSGGGWTVIQQRRNGKVDFNRDWDDYKTGFGNFKEKNDEFWLGNEHIYALLNEGENLMKVELMDWSGERSYALYENVRISDEKDGYRLQFGLYSGRAGDALSGGGHMEEQWSMSHSGMQFSTRDRDQDRYLQGNCAKENKGGWWYNRCHATNLNGKYYSRGQYQGKYDNGVVWLTWRGLWYSLRHTTMKIRPLLFMDDPGSGEGPLA